MRERRWVIVSGGQMMVQGKTLLPEGHMMVAIIDDFRNDSLMPPQLLRQGLAGHDTTANGYIVH